MYACTQGLNSDSHRALEQLHAHKAADAAAAGQIDLVRGLESVDLLVLDEMRAEAAR